MIRNRSLPEATRRRLWTLLSGLAAAAVLGLVANVSVAGATTVVLSMDVAGMSYWDEASQIGGTCGKVVPSHDREFNGTTAAVGALIADLNLPQGASLTSLTIVARDNDADNGAHAFIVRKHVAASNTIDGFQGYKVLASASTSNAHTSMGISTATTTQISGRIIKNQTFAYMAEIINCVDTVDPIAVQVVYSK